MKRRFVVFYTAGVVLIFIFAGTVAVFFGAFQSSVVGSEVEEPLSPDERKALAERGAYVATAADCYACHTAPGGAPWAGGLPIETPFGIIYATNISPDREHGIGEWTRAEFHRAMRDGVGKHGAPLYPAMPYVSYRKMTPEDIDAVYAYLMTREPMPVADKTNELTFPFNMRRLLRFWNLLNLPGDTFQARDDRSEQWNRGHYVVDALGHCGECHTPRNAMMGMKESAYLQGAVLEGMEAPDVTREGLLRMGFDAPSLAHFMQTGVSAQGGMTGDMFEVVHFSTQYMRQEDLDAMAAYLFDVDDIAAAEGPLPQPEPVEVSAEIAASARGTYLNLCSGCHGASGEGIPHVAVPMTTNITLRLEDPRNFLQTVLHGIPELDFPGLERMQPMPRFANKLNDQELADLANWMRARWGGQESDVSPSDVEKLRREAHD